MAGTLAMATSTGYGTAIHGTPAPCLANSLLPQDSADDAQVIGVRDSQITARRAPDIWQRQNARSA
jgi:hypothetical protein